MQGKGYNTDADCVGLQVSEKTDRRVHYCEMQVKAARLWWSAASAFRVPTARLLCLAICLVVTSVWVDCARADDEVFLDVVGDEGYQLLARLFDYDAVPLDAVVLDSVNTLHGRRLKIVFQGLWHSRVPAYFEIPAEAEPPYPCVLLLHDLAGSKSQWWPLVDSPEGRHCKRLVGEGMAVFSIDMPLHGDRLAENEFAHPRNLIENHLDQRYRELFVQAVQENRRALDYLTARPDIDSDRVGALGYGLGASMALCLAAVDARVAVVVAAAPPAEPDKLAVRAAQNYAGRVRGQPILLQGGNYDPWTTPVATQQLYELLATTAKDLKEYHSDHRLPIWYINDSVAWFVSHLK